MIKYDGMYASLNLAVKKGYAKKIFLVEMTDNNDEIWFTEFKSLIDAKEYKRHYANKGYTNIHIGAIAIYE